jgi:hypothetical protein
VLSKGFLGFGSKTIERHDDGGTPRFWVIGARRERGMWAVYRPEAPVREHCWMAGPAAILLEDGAMRYAEWQEEPIGSDWHLSTANALPVSGMTILDYADMGVWRRVKPHAAEQYSETFLRKYVANVHAPGVGLSLSLKRLLEGKGHLMHGVPTGLATRPRGPER